MLIYYICDYFCTDIKRRRELQLVMNANINLNFFDKIIVMFQDYEQHKHDDSLKYLQNDKITVINMNKRQTYKDMFEHSFNYKDSIIVISNSDILFDKTINRINEMDFNDNFACAITRWQLNKNDNTYEPPFQSQINMNWSYDTYVFGSNLKVNLESIDINIGVGGCDTYLVKKLIVDNNIMVINPNLDIRTWHIDYRFENDPNNRSYNNMITYNSKNDYPRGSNNFYNNIIPFGGQIGLKMKNVDCDLVIQNSLKIKKKLKVISFSLYGNLKKYCEGALRNANIALSLYPEWICYFYIDLKSVPENIIEKLKEYPNVKVIEIQKNYLKMCSRFLAFDDTNVDIIIFRDCDSRLTIREKEAVNDWIKSGKTMHIMRDHPHHTLTVLGGMFGIKKSNYLNFKIYDILDIYKQYDGVWGIDCKIIENEIYKICKIKDDIKIHASYNNYESYTEPFPIPYDSERHFVGEYIDENEVRGEHYKMINI
jgi:hypothetical protein